MYRQGSQIRVRISAPNGDQPIWSFGETDPAGQANVAIGYGGTMPSRLLLPVIPGVSTSTALPPCPGLRGEPCRDYQPFTNQAAALSTAAATPGTTETSGFQSGAASKKKKKCKKRKRRKSAAAARKKCHKHHRR
jgi:hypothetical protein